MADPGYEVGYLDRNSERVGIDEEDALVLDSKCSGIDLNQLDISKLAEVTAGYGINEVYGVRRNSLEPSSSLAGKRYFGIGFETEEESAVIVTHPYDHVPFESHEHFTPVLRSYISSLGGQESFENEAQLGEDIVSKLAELEETRWEEEWKNWIDETGYVQAGIFEKRWIKLKESTPNKFGNVPPAVITSDLENSGLKGRKIQELARRI